MLRWKNGERTVLVIRVNGSDDEMQQLAQEVLNAQDACNVVAVANAFHLALLKISRSTQNTAGGIYTAMHPVTQLWIAKLEHLADLTQSTKSETWNQVYDLSTGKDIEFEVTPDERDLETFRHQVQ